MDDSYAFLKYTAIIPPSLRHFQHSFANVEYDAVCQCCKIPASTSEHITKTLFQFVLIYKMAST
jgi:hypothetical protein